MLPIWRSFKSLAITPIAGPRLGPRPDSTKSERFSEFFLAANNKLEMLWFASSRARQTSVGVILR